MKSLKSLSLQGCLQIFLLIAQLTVIPLITASLASDFDILRQGPVTVYFEPSLDAAARQIRDMYPNVRSDLKAIFGWDLDRRSFVLLIGDTHRFQEMAESPLTVAFAVPQKDLIVMDHSRVTVTPFSLPNTLRHELCHLLLHNHIRTDHLPRWLDEGLCQWVSHGIGDIMVEQKRSVLNGAALRGQFIPLSYLERGFPRNSEALILAYEESKSFVDHLISEFGKDRLLMLVDLLREGRDLHAAFAEAFSVPLDTLEREWQDSLKSGVTNWMAYLSYYLYEILFALMAILAVFAFVKALLRKKRGGLEEEMEDSD